MLPKPIKGAYLLERRAKRRSRVTAEQKVMHAAKTRDRGKCQWPECDYAGQHLPIDVCHQKHRGMGGDPKGVRTTRKTVISLCRVHHGMWDHGDVGIYPIGPDGFDGPRVFLDLRPR